ncbi:MAG: transferrin-binding protein-like solute binding protein [Roseovarius sp.]|uniref:transferrin-binding protein-like solute binding protein n=1 Tax=Roseovarius sp. TaxID=1486281 RepID=UPI001B3FB0AC|nr:transferrin-binding protein-like solute binding protein [Roseovarius sp.]MBQ0749604.1 transferrin-binding protein-like solute binding protein [Roseovarius sp.]MBQ0810637.1 transferrin-binding protein-like solute binding protein [Roseovarius sp.]
MKHIVAGLMAAALLGGCGGGSSNPFDNPGEDDGTTPPPTDTSVPTDIAQDVSRVQFDPATQTLTVEGLSFDGTTDPVTYNRAAALDVPGYQAYTIQQDGASRHSTAFAAQSQTSGSVTAGVAATGGPRNRFFIGAVFERTGTYTQPTTGEVVYTGRYVGLTNLDSQGGDLLPPPAGVSPELIPTQAASTQGDVVLRANFGDRQVEGNIINRRISETPGGVVINLPSLVLINAAITEGGTFSGTIEYDQSAFPDDRVTGTSIGSSAGIFGGTGATEVAGAIKINEFDGPGNPLGLTNELETGIFVLDR